MAVVDGWQYTFCEIYSVNRLRKNSFDARSMSETSENAELWYWVRSKKTDTRVPARALDCMMQ